MSSIFSGLAATSRPPQSTQADKSQVWPAAHRADGPPVAGRPQVAAVARFGLLDTAATRHAAGPQPYRLRAHPKSPTKPLVRVPIGRVGASLGAGLGVVAGFLLLSFAGKARHLEPYKYPEAIKPGGATQNIRHMANHFLPSAANDLAKAAMFFTSFCMGIACLYVAGRLTHRAMVQPTPTRAVWRFGAL